MGMGQIFEFTVDLSGRFSGQPFVAKSDLEFGQPDDGEMLSQSLRGLDGQEMRMIPFTIRNCRGRCEMQSQLFESAK
jgi:hypothetical protein